VHLTLVLYLSGCNAVRPCDIQVVSASEDGVVSIWMLDTSQKVKQWTDAHGSAKLMTLAQDHSETRIVTGAADGTVKVKTVSSDRSDTDDSIRLSQFLFKARPNYSKYQRHLKAHVSIFCHKILNK